MNIQTGKGTIPLVILLGIWSISALNAIPGLAVSPILGEMSTIFPHASEFDIQLLSSLPSLLTIPFVLLSGKLTERVNNIVLLQIGALVFALTGLLYLLSTQMWQLIAVSALLGIGSGMIVPLSTGFISRYFTGKYRTRQFGLSSAITNIALVSATLLTGYLAEVDWHLPFVVYFLPVVTFVFSFYLKRGPAPEEIHEQKKKQGGAGKIYIKQLVGLMFFYGLITYLVIIVSFNLPFLMQENHFDAEASGVVISLFYLAIVVPGFFLNRILSACRSLTKCLSLLCIAIGLALILVSTEIVVMSIGAILMGFGYGVMQPVIYDQTTRVASPEKTTLALAFVMSMNYLAILLAPPFIDALSSIFHIHSQQFAFVLNLCITLLAVVWSYVGRRTFLFNDSVDNDKTMEAL